MVVSHNLSALNANRMYGINSFSQSKSTEKLSSGYRINRAADDAAGLAISEKMRRQVRGLTQASANCQEGIGICQTRDGALSEVHDILNRMNELSIKAANGTLSDQDRSYIQTEVDQLVSEINRIGKNTTFNELHIFDYDPPGTTSGTGSSTSAIGTGYLTDSYHDSQGYHPSANLNFSGVNASTVDQLYGKSFRFTCSQSCSEAFKFTFKGDGDGTKSSASNLSGKTEHMYVIDITGETTAQGVLDKLFSFVQNNIPNGYSAGNVSDMLVSHSNRLVRTSPESFSIVSTAAYPTESQAKNKFALSNGAYGKAECSELASVVHGDEYKVTLPIHAGEEAGQYIFITMDKMNAGILGLDPTDVSTQNAADIAIAKIKSAFRIISRQRSDAGSEQNRLEHAILNLDNITENTTAAESRLRDTEMAKEMVAFANTNILLQANQAMMAQANQTNEGVLALLS